MESKIWHRHVPKGQSVSLNYPITSVDVVLRTAAHDFPERTALVYLGAEVTFSELWDYSRRFSRALAEMGVGRGDVVAIQLTNCPQFAIAYYGILLSGATFSPANPLLSARELAHQLKDCGAVVVVTSDQFCQTVLEVLPRTDIRTIVMTSASEAVDRQPIAVESFGSTCVSFQSLLDFHEPDPPPVDLDPKTDLAHIGYTGGTTGLSKGVALTHYSILANIVQSYTWGDSGEPVMEDGLLRFRNRYRSAPGEPWEYVSEIEDEGCIVTISPWFHAMGVIGYLNISILRGFKSVLMERFEPVSYLDAVEEHQATYIGGAPPVYQALINTADFERRKLSSIRRIVSGAAPLPVELAGKLQEAFPNAIIGEGYGLTEVTMAVTYNPTYRSGLRKIGSVGVPLSDTDIRIVDIETGEKSLDLNEEGELCFKGPQCMQGYYNRPQETSEVIRNGWLHTGDIGFMDEDGFGTIVDRKKDMLLYKGYNVYPRELEELLYTHPAVVQCAVIGVPESAVGELAKAIVVKRPQFDITEDDLMAFVNQQVVPYKKIRLLEFASSIPVSAAGKILKRELK